MTGVPGMGGGEGPVTHPPSLPISPQAAVHTTSEKWRVGR